MLLRDHLQGSVCGEGSKLSCFRGCCRPYKQESVVWSPVTELACLLSVSLMWTELKYQTSFFCMENRLSRYSVTFSRL